MSAVPRACAKATATAVAARAASANDMTRRNMCPPWISTRGIRRRTPERICHAGSRSRPRGPGPRLYEEAVTSEPLRQLLLRLHGRVDAHDLDKLRVPDTRASRAAEELAAAGQTQSLTNHGIRSYGFGALLGIGEGRRFDAEVFYVAALIHDIGLMPAFDHGNRFEADGEQAARELLLEVGWPIERADQAAHAIRDHWGGPENEDEV